MFFYTTLIAKNDFEIGQLSAFAIEKSPMDAGWVVLISGKTRGGYLSTARNPKEPRVFKTIDGAVIALEEIGFRVTRLTR